MDGLELHKIWKKSVNFMLRQTHAGFRGSLVTCLVDRWGSNLGFTKFAGKRSVNAFFHVVLKCWLVIGGWFI